MTLEKLGYQQSSFQSAVYSHPKRTVVIVAHVDDFLVQGTVSELRMLLSDLQRDYECTGQILGNGEGCQDVLKFLGRTIRLTPAGLEWEGDQKHAAVFIEKMTEVFWRAE